MNHRKLTLAASTQAHLIVAGSASEAGIESYEAFERLVNHSLMEWTRPLACIVVPDSLDEYTRDMANRYARERMRKLHTVRGKWHDFGLAAAPIRDRELLAQATHAILFAAQENRDTRAIYHRVVREAMPFVKVD